MTGTTEPKDPTPCFLGSVEFIEIQNVLPLVATCESHRPAVIKLAETLIYWESVRPDLNGAKGIADLILAQVHCTDPNALFCTSHYDDATTHLSFNASVDALSSCICYLTSSVSYSV
jgi:hypothetical protein